MKRNRLAWTPAVGLIGVLAGCAAITQGTTQLVQIESQPAGAICAFTREGQSLGSVTTPGSLPIKRGAQSITVTCTKEDYEDARAIMNSQLEPATAVNALVGGIVGVAVDRASGAANRYETSLRVELTPLSPADQAARAIAKTIPASPPAVAASVQAPAATALVPTAASGSFDGEYNGSAQLNSGSLRQIEVRVVGRDGVGTARLAGCAEAGNVKFVIDQAGAITGDADIRARATCAPSHHKLDGRVDGNRLLITLAPNARFPGVGEFSLVQRANPR